uniref:Uncharacterized protein n=1 Tax=Hypsizygus marmoreus TaxID=39966 RepID=A0A4P8D2T8_HYPMA|nr:hypothetical protein [Hypsizygus marmoreus]
MIFFIFSKIALFSFWFCIGLYSYTYLFKGKYSSILKLYIIKLNIIELILVLFTLFFCFSFIFLSMTDSYLTSELFNLEYRLNVSDINTGDNSESGNTAPSSNNSSSLNNDSKDSATSSNTTSSSNTSNTSKSSRSFGKQSKGGDSLIMATALGSGIKLAAHQPSLVGKAGVLVGSIGLGAGAIAAKNLSSNMSDNLGRDKFFPLEDNILDMFNLTGNDAIDLLILIRYFHRLQLIFLFLIIYNSFMLYIDEKKTKTLLSNILPANIVQLFMKSLIIIKKSGLILIFFFVYSFY